MWNDNDLTINDSIRNFILVTNIRETPSIIFIINN